MKLGIYDNAGHAHVAAALLGTLPYMSKPPATVPQLFVHLKQQYGFRRVFLRLAAHYLYILYFAVRGHRAFVHA